MSDNNHNDNDASTLVRVAHRIMSKEMQRKVARKKQLRDKAIKYCKEMYKVIMEMLQDDEVGTQTAHLLNKNGLKMSDVFLEVIEEEARTNDK